MLIRFAGPAHGRRVWPGGPVFGQAEGLVHEVDGETAALMLMTPGERFVIDDAEPLLGLMTADEAGLLTLEGIGSVAELAALEDIEALAKGMGMSTGSVEEWIERARAAADAPADRPVIGAEE